MTPEQIRRMLASIGVMPLIGEAAIREAFEGDLRQLQDLLQGKIKAALEISGEDEWWPYVRALFSDFIIVEAKNGKLMKYTYMVDGTDVTLGNPVEVVLSYDEVREAVSGTISRSGTFMEASEGKVGSEYRIRVISAGASGNNNYYPDAVLREAVSMFNGTRVFVKSDADHLSGKGKDVRNIIGALSDAEFVEGKAPDTGEIHATFKLLEPEGDIGVKLREAWDRDMTGLFGFSIDVKARAKVKTTGGRRFREATQFIKVESVDLIVEPGAGGAVLNLIEAKKEDTSIMNREQIIALLEAKGILTATEAEGLTDDQLTERLTEAVNTPATTDDGGLEEGDATTLNRLREAMRQETAMREAVKASKLPDAAKGRIIAMFEARDSYTAADVTMAIKEESDYIGQFSESGTVSGLGGGRVEVGDSNLNAVHMFEAFFDTAHEDHRHARSIKDIYAQITGDRLVTGRMENCNRSVMREAFGGAADELGIFLEAIDSTTFATVLGNVMHRRLLADYRNEDQYSVWRQLAVVGNASDFKQKTVSRVGGYGDLPGVAQSGDYLPLSSPTEENASYAVTKRGGTEKITIEAIKNDDVLALRRIPGKLSRAAKRTLAKFVLEFLNANPNAFDGVALFHASHNNLGTAALDEASLDVLRLAMLAQQEADSNDPIGITPRNLWVPPTLLKTATDMFRRSTENDKTFIQSLILDIIPVWYWTDANNWYLTADKDEIPTVELSFLDGNEEPELFVQDDPRSGSLFTNDEITYKIRHIYGGSIVDYRGAQGAIVA